MSDTCGCTNKVKSRDDSRAVVTEHGVTTRIVTESIACRCGVQVIADINVCDGEEDDLLAAIVDPRSRWESRVLSWDDYHDGAEQDLVNEVMAELQGKHGMYLTN